MKANKLTIIVGILSCIILVLAGYIGYIQFSAYQYQKMELAYKQGALDAQNIINSEIMKGLETNGYITFTYLDEKNQSQTIILAPLQPQQQAQNSNSRSK